MNYTLSQGIDDRQERVESFILKVLPILVASAIAIFGAFSQANKDTGEVSSKRPLAIYTAPPAQVAGDSGSAGNNSGSVPTGGGQAETAAMNPQSGPAPAGNQLSTALPQSTVSGGRGSSDTSSSGTSGTSNSGSSGCICQDLQNTVDTQTASLTGAVPSTTSTGNILNTGLGL